MLRRLRGRKEGKPRTSIKERVEARQDGDVDQAKWFQADTKPQYRRLKVLGIMEHHPAIAANCEVDPLTMKDIEEAIIVQKARCTAKQLKQYKHAKEQVEQGGPFLISKSKNATRSCPKWKRTKRESEEERKEEEVECKQAYTNRLIKCR